MIVYANSAFEHLLGTTSSFIIGAPIESFIDPKDLAVFRQLFQSSFSGQSKGEVLLSFKDKKVPVYVSLSSLYPRFAGIGIIITDLSEKKKQKRFTDRLQQKIQEDSSFIKQVLDASVELVSTFDRNLNYISINKAALQATGLPVEQVLGKNVTEVYPDIGETTQLQNMQRALRGEEVHERQTPGLRQKNLCFDIYFKPLITNGEIRGVLVMARDITQAVLSKRQLEEINLEMERKILRLNHVNTEYSALGQIAASKLQQSLQKIPSFALRIKENLKETAESEIGETIESITGTTQELMQQTKTLLHYFAPDKAEVYPNVNMNVIFEEVKRDLVDLLKASDAIIDSANLPSLRVDALQIRLVFSKIISNAIKFREGKERPYIKLSVEFVTEEFAEAELKTKKKYWKITISDNGTGLSGKRLDDFPPHSRKSRLQEKTDLSVCRRILQNHNGLIKVKSEPGIGTDFILYLPH
jgi:PAS domain S-box-containing protein